jgi:hypothetical protein
VKKLLLILLYLPFIGFGQDDKIIFSSGDTIYGRVIEVGVNDITYQYNDEATNNVTRKRGLAKVIYSSGRIEGFEGLNKLKSNIAKEQKKEENKKIITKKREKRIEKGIVNKWSFKLGGNMLFPFSKTFDEFGRNIQLTSGLGYSTEISYLYAINNSYSYVSSVSFNNVAYKESYSFNYVLPTSASGDLAIIENYENESIRNSINLTQQAAYNLNNNITLFLGCSFDQLILSEIREANKISNRNVIYETSLSLLFSINYSITKIKNHPIFIFSNLKLPFYIRNSKFKNTNTPSTRGFQINRHLTFGIGLYL